MRVAYTSDLHADFGPQNQALGAALAARAAALRPDVLVVCGDVAETAAGVRDSLAHFTTLPCRKLYVAGNHDLYVEGDAALRRGETSRFKFEHALPAAAAAAGFETLGHAPLAVGAATFVGVPGWYDFTLRDPALDASVSLHHYRAGRWRDHRAFDRGHVFWEPDAATPAGASTRWAGDEAIATWMWERLDAQLRAAPAQRPIVAAVHVLPFAELVQRGAFGPHAFHEAYLGSARLGARLLADARVRAVVTGHLHRPADRDLGGVRVVARPVGNLRETVADLDAVAATRLDCFVLESSDDL